MKKAIISLVCVAVIAGFAYRSGQIAGNERSDEHYLSWDVRGEMALDCESQIADNARNANVKVSFGKHTVQYNASVMTFSRQNVFTSNGNQVWSLVSDTDYVQVSQVADFATVQIRHKGESIDYLQCTIIKG